MRALVLRPTTLPFLLTPFLARRQVRDLKDTFGVCISAGGLRSVAFGVGALRALATAGAIPPREGLRATFFAGVAPGVPALSQSGAR
jgi:hypothetical protein